MLTKPKQMVIHKDAFIGVNLDALCKEDPLAKYSQSREWAMHIDIFAGSQPCAKRNTAVKTPRKKTRFEQVAAQRRGQPWI
jgi:hypothetical protein